MDSKLDIGRRGRLLRLASYASVATATTLVLVKLLAWLATGSVSMLASLVDSLMDSIASLINLLAVHVSLRPPDAQHRFGHGKAEPLAGLAQACFIGGSAVFLLLHAIDRLRHPVALESVAVALGVMLLAIVLTLALLLWQRYVIRRTGSSAIRADSLHYASDLLSNLSILLALWLASHGWASADPLLAIGVAVYIFYSALRIGREAVAQLMDAELPIDLQQDITQLALGEAGVRGVHDLRTRQSGQVKFIQLHLELDDELPLYRAHAIADEVESKIRAKLPEAEVLVHQDPASVRSEAG